MQPDRRQRLVVELGHVSRGRANHKTVALVGFRQRTGSPLLGPLEGGRFTYIREYSPNVKRFGPKPTFGTGRIASKERPTWASSMEKPHLSLAAAVASVWRLRGVLSRRAPTFS